MARLSLYIALWLACSIPCESRVLRGQSRLHSRSRMGTMSEQTACDCKNCMGYRKIDETTASGFKGFQCRPREGIAGGVCKQQGDTSTWVVQNAVELTYERFCYFTCKPVIPKQLTPNVDCTQLTPAEAQAGQSAGGNGVAMIYSSNPLTDSVTLEELNMPTYGAPDGVKNLEEAVTEVGFYNERQKVLAEEAAAKAAESKKQSAPKPGFCLCRCPAPPTTTGPLAPYNPFKTPPPLPAAPPKAPGLPPPPPPPPLPPPALPGPPPLPPLPMVLPKPLQAGPTMFPPPPPTLQPTPGPPATTTINMLTYNAEAVTNLTMKAFHGNTTLEVLNQAGFVAGRTIIIDNPPEVNRIVGFGSLKLEWPLFQDHPIGATIVMEKEAPLTTTFKSNFEQPFPERFHTEVGSNTNPVGPFFPTYGPMGPPTTTFPGFGPAPAAFGYGMTSTTFGYGTTTYGYGTTTYGYGMPTTPYPYLLLDMSSGGNADLPAVPQLASMTLAPDAAMIQLAEPALPPVTLPPMAFSVPNVPPMAMSALSNVPPMAFPAVSYMPPGGMAFIQESMQDTSSLFRSSKPLDGCDCECAKREAALLSAQRNAFRLAAFPEEEGETTPWGHAA